MSGAADALTLLRGVDVYLIDQLLKGRGDGEPRVLDMGCGKGRNLAWFAAAGCDVVGVDANAAAVAAARARYREGRFVVGPAEEFATDEPFDIVLAIALFHLLASEAQFDAVFAACWRALRPGGMLFARLSTRIAFPAPLEPRGGDRYRMPFGADWYLADEAKLAACEARVGATRLEPLKTVVVADQRTMTTWVLRKD